MKKLKRLGIDYWKYWLASAGSMAASNILQYVLALYVMDLTGSATIFASMLSIILFPRLLLTPLAGVILDRTNRMKAMSFILLGETAVLVLFFLIARIMPIHVAGIFALVTILEIGEVFYGAAENAVIPKLVGKELLPDAIAVSKADDGIVFVLSPMVAAIIYTKLNLPMAFLIVGILDFLGALIQKSIVSDCSSISEKKDFSFWNEFKEGIDEKYLGRVSSVIGMVTSISIAAGELLFGILDDQINVPFTIIVGAVGVAVGAMIYSFGGLKSKSYI